MTTWADLELLEALLDAGTLTAAAQALGVNQTTASRRLARMDQRFGAALFDRVEGRLVPSPLLTQALPALRSMADAAVQAGAMLAQARVELAGRVTLSCLGFHAAHHLAPHFGSLVQRHPKIALEILAEDRLSNFEAREADIAIRFAWPDDSVALMRRLSSVTFRRYRAGQPRAAVVAYTEALAHTPEMQLLTGLRPGIVPVLRANRLDVLANAAASAGADVMLPEGMGDTDPRFVRADADTVLAERPIVLLIHPDRRRAPSVTAVVDWLTDLHGAG